MYSRYLRSKLAAEEDTQKERQRAIALGYDAEKDIAPRVLATGLGAVANKIIELAKENGIPIREDPLLEAALANVELESTIPPELYVVVAEVLTYIYRIKKKN